MEVDTSWTILDPMQERLPVEKGRKLWGFFILPVGSMNLLGLNLSGSVQYSSEKLE
jgi:hypothetical protein